MQTESKQINKWRRKQLGRACSTQMLMIRDSKVHELCALSHRRLESSSNSRHGGTVHSESSRCVERPSADEWLLPARVACPAPLRPARGLSVPSAVATRLGSRDGELVLAIAEISLFVALTNGAHWRWRLTKLPKTHVVERTSPGRYQHRPSSPSDTRPDNDYLASRAVPCPRFRFKARIRRDVLAAGQRQRRARSTLRRLTGERKASVCFRFPIARGVRAHSGTTTVNTVRSELVCAAHTASEQRRNLERKNVYVALGRAHVCVQCL